MCVGKCFDYFSLFFLIYFSKVNVLSLSLNIFITFRRIHIFRDNTHVTVIKSIYFFLLFTINFIIESETSHLKKKIIVLMAYTQFLFFLNIWIDFVNGSKFTVQTWEYTYVSVTNIKFIEFELQSNKVCLMCQQHNYKYLRNEKFKSLFK